VFEPGDLPQVLAIGRAAFVFDRFHADPQLSPAIADRVNESWTRNCCLGSAADVTVLAEDEGRIASFVACRADREARRGSIILVATAEWARGRGMARRANSAALQWFAGQGMDSVEVGTQFRNIPAARLFQSLGFRLFQTALTFRRIL
jgi:RimJ/RimL family protein N-acetyltransferase